MKTLRPATGLTQSVQRLTAEREVASSISGAGSILRPLIQALSLPCNYIITRVFAWLG